ncbi:MAG: hypothetical protein JWR83_240 [Aeromicrobium sp.]|nr:hypothetical protein [Aeromicrobium sp.]
MAAVLTAAMVAVAAYCAMRLVVPAWRDDDHPLELDVLHVVMGAVMIAMLIDVLPRDARTVAIGAFALAGTWCFARSLAGQAKRLYSRFGVVCLGMVAMFAPHAALATTAGHQAVSAQPAQMPGMAGHMGGGFGLPDLGDATSLIGILAVIAMMSVALSAVVQLGTDRGTIACRLSAACEIAMATAMGYLLAMAL